MEKLRSPSLLLQHHKQDQLIHLIMSVTQSLVLCHNQWKTQTYVSYIR